MVRMIAVMGLLGSALVTGGYASRAAAAGGLVDGEYDCGGGYTYRAMGKVDIQGNRFRYRPYGDVINGFAPFSMDASGAIQWGGPFGGLDEAPAQIVASKREAFGFNVMYNGNPTALINTMSCHAPGK
ncbi:MAG: hypothetical protein NTV97_16790 [Alphaproteobacteria bacterium]|nr:hypothetical protein [Alphaproteobacteria bacterium]